MTQPIQNNTPAAEAPSKQLPVRITPSFDIGLAGKGFPLFNIVDGYSLSPQLQFSKYLSTKNSNAHVGFIGSARYSYTGTVEFQDTIAGHRAGIGLGLSLLVPDFSVSLQSLHQYHNSGTGTHSYQSGLDLSLNLHFRDITGVPAVVGFYSTISDVTSPMRVITGLRIGVEFGS